MKTIVLHVSAHESVMQALQSVPADHTGEIIIHIAPGFYYEKVTLDRPFLTLIGDSPETTVITFDDHANALMPDGLRRGTFRSYTMLIDAHDVCLKNLTVENASAPRSLAGQAIALYADGDRLVFDNCRFLGFQDTLFTGPLPEKEYQPGGFVGPKEFAPRINGRHYYHHCLIAGDIDFIFGSATAYFEDCEIRSVHNEELPREADGSTPVYGYITAASTPCGQSFGYVFHNCRLTGECPEKSVYLGRPWRDYAKTVFLSCRMDAHIKPEGFHDWDKTHARDLLFFGEYNSYGEGSAFVSRAPFVKNLSKIQADAYTREKVLGGTDHWNPSLL